MKSLITPAQVVATAFGDSEYIAPEVIVEADIAAACHHYITPIIGPTLLEALLDGRYPALLDNYVAPALAFAVRCSIQPSLNVRTCEQGLSLPAGGGSASTTAAAEALVASLPATPSRKECFPHSAITGSSPALATLAHCKQ